MTNGNRTDTVRLIDHGPQIVGLVVFVLALWAQVPDAFVGRFLGDGLNLVLAKSLARGDGLTFMHFVDRVPALWVYPLYPMLVSFVGRVWSSFPDNVVLIQILDSCLLGCAAWILSLQVRKLDLPKLPLYVVVALGFVSTRVLSLAVSAFPEPLFLVIAASCVVLVDRERMSHWTTVGAGFLSGAAVLTGPLGVFVVLGVGVALLVKGRAKLAGLVTVIAVLVAAPWFIWSATAADPTGLASVANQAAKRAADMRGVVSWQGIGPLVGLALPATPMWLVNVLGPVAAAFFGAGILATFNASPGFALVVTSCTIGAWLHPGAVARNEWVLFPWFACLMAIGTYRSWGYARQLRIPVLVAAIALTVSYVPPTLTSVVSRNFASDLAEQNEYLGVLVRSINAELPEDAVFAADAEAMIHLYTGRSVIPARLGPREDATVERYCAARVDYVVYANLPVPDPVDEGFVRSLGSVLAPAFRLTNGPALYRFTCPS